MPVATLNWSAGTNTAVNVLGFSAFNGDTAFLAAGNIGEAVADTFIGRICSNWTLDSVTISGDQPVTVSNGDSGGLNETCTSANVSYLVNKTPIAGRRGRMYLPGVPEGAIGVSGDVTSGSIDAMNVQLTQFLADLTTLNYPLVMRFNQLSEAPIQDLDLDGRVATQRRRLRR